MGRFVLGYVVFMLVLFLVLTVAVGVKAALWTFGVVHVSCALGAGVCVWWEGEALQFPQLERESMAPYRGGGDAIEGSEVKDALFQGNVVGLRR